jgi:hypothetical protein
MDNTEKIFADGFIFKMNPNSHEFVVGSLSLKADDAIAFIKQRESKGWVNLNVKIAKSGKPYVELDTWKPNAAKTNDSAVDFNADGSSDLPF